MSLKHNVHMINKSNFELSFICLKNPNQIDHLGRERIELNPALPRHPQQVYYLH